MYLSRKFWEGHQDAGIQAGVLEKLYAHLNDAVPEVRTAALFALSNLLGVDKSNEESIEIEEGIVTVVSQLSRDLISPR